MASTARATISRVALFDLDHLETMKNLGEGPRGRGGTVAPSSPVTSVKAIVPTIRTQLLLGKTYRARLRRLWSDTRPLRQGMSD